MAACWICGVTSYQVIGSCTCWEDQYRVRPCRKTGFRRRSSKKVLAPVQYCASDLFDFLDHWTLRTSFFSCTNFLVHKPEFLSCILGRPSPPTRGILDNKRWNTFCLCWSFYQLPSCWLRQKKWRLCLDCSWLVSSTGSPPDQSGFLSAFFL